MTFPPTLILVAGGPGAGKTALGRALAREISASILLDKDVAASGWVDAFLSIVNEGQVDRDSEIYWRSVRPLEYASLMALAMDNLALQKSVVVVAPFLVELADPVWTAKLQTTVTELGARLAILWIETDSATARIRMTRRDDSRDAWKLSHWDQFAGSAQFGPPMDGFAVLRNGEGATLSDVLDQALAHLKSL